VRPPAVEVRDLFRIYSTPEGDAAALQGLTLSLAERDVLVLLGPSGSGKTTLLQVLAGLDRASAGSVRVFGEELGSLGRRGLARYRGTLGYVDQHYARSLAPELTARELVSLQLGLAGRPRGARLARADELLERVGLRHLAEAPPAELSGGEQQRVAVCAALAHGPRLLLADEPTGELDADNAAAIYRLLGELVREHGCTAVVVSHDPASAAVADRVVTIRDGRVSEELTPGEGGDEAIVVGRGGWLRLPEELLARAGVRERAAARLEDRNIVITSREPGQAGDETAVRAREAAEPSRATVAEVEGVRKAFGSGGRATVVFDGLDAEFEAGRLLAVTGRSGTGKTTLLHLLAALELPDDGVVRVLGIDLASRGREGRAAFRRDAIALVGQEPGLVPFLSARENVELALAVRGVARGEAQIRARTMLAAVGLEERADQRVERLSTGERGRVAVARALAARPALLLADEPTSRLDQANAVTTAALLARLAAESGAAVVCATHDPVVVDHADSVLPLGPGYSASAAEDSRSRPLAIP